MTRQNKRFTGLALLGTLALMTALTQSGCMRSKDSQQQQPGQSGSSSDQSGGSDQNQQQPGATASPNAQYGAGSSGSGST